MPIEREFKYVLHDPDLDLMRLLNYDIERNSIEIIQAYLPDGGRIRCSIPESRVKEYFFTYKIKVEDDVVEIETPITEDDYTKLLSVSTQKLAKTRLEVKDGENCVWAFDFFWESLEGDDDPYFVMAEFETKYDIRTAPELPYYAKPYLIHVDDGRYNLSSHSLCHIPHAKNVMWELLENGSR